MQHFYYPEKLRHQTKFSSRVIILTLFFCSQAVAVPQVINVPDTGAISNEIRQTIQEPLGTPQETELKLPPIVPTLSSGGSIAAEKIILREVRFEGDTLLLIPSNDNNNTLRFVITPWLGQRLNFNDLQAMTLAVTRFYRQQGFVAAQAILPPQTIHEGIVVVRILAGRLDKPEVDNQSRLNSGFATVVIESNSCSKQVVFLGDKDCSASPAELSRLERTAIILNEIPGVDASLALKPGTQPGMTRIYADITPGQTAMGYIGADNQGNDYSGHNRLFAGGALNNMTGWGDQLRTDLILSSSGDVFNGLLDYNFPINTYGTRIALNYSYLDYTLQGPFKILDARGHSNTWGVNLRHPWIRNSAARVDVNAGYYQSKMQDSLIMLPNQKRNLNAGEFGINGTFSVLPRGLSHFYLLGTAGHLSLDDEFSQRANTVTRIAGTFARSNYRAGHDQGFGPYFSFFNQFTGQMASKNLDSSQKLLLGGPLAVRAYGIGEGAVDNGTIFTTELRVHWQPPFPDWAGAGNKMSFAAFFDQGWGSYYRQPIEGMMGNNINLSGFGTYFTLSRQADYSLNLTWAHRTGQAATPQPDNNQLWLSAYKMF
ncbi:ShlB/FhaC/HecB family hemolysin secretion/activation protein [Yersinia hibernica]|uniref:ShlB/FhaC/HecB family hemolysin secretion/activation protein n=1 Tax=Yersinia hibernica TaxID=2339259 RepID=A0ABX5R266_9GAMM|nr:ShlB/FhaC/HecB family hemolysin secretion/activation protein [Yersinia hibernica]QAX79627.1 ShlB/FhaC/HecB family hemolysin secretion/activation protein [Yersinia hibernica]